MYVLICCSQISGQHSWTKKVPHLTLKLPLREKMTLFLTDPDLRPCMADSLSPHIFRYPWSAGPHHRKGPLLASGWRVHAAGNEAAERHRRPRPATLDVSHFDIYSLLSICLPLHIFKNSSFKCVKVRLWVTAHST